MIERSTILLLEDEQTIADTIVYAFESDGFLVSHHLTCGSALEKVKEGGVDVAIFDVGLPDGTGFDLCKQIRSFSSLPVLFLTARADEIDRVVGLEIGGDDYVTKPFSPRELVARVKAILRRTRPEPMGHEPKSSEKGLTLDAERCLFLFHGQSMVFTKAEYQLLLALFRSPGRVFSREQLLDRISIDPGAAMDRVVDAHVKAIRAKLGDVSQDGKTMIETRRGLGYALKS